MIELLVLIFLGASMLLFAFQDEKRTNKVIFTLGFLACCWSSFHVVKNMDKLEKIVELKK